MVWTYVWVWGVQWETPSVGMRVEKSAGERLKAVAGSGAVIPPYLFSFLPVTGAGRSEEGGGGSVGSRSRHGSEPRPSTEDPSRQGLSRPPRPSKPRQLGNFHTPQLRDTGACELHNTEKAHTQSYITKEVISICHLSIQEEKDFIQHILLCGNFS